MENKLDQLFRNKLSKYEENPSSNAWEQIHHNLASRRRGLWTRRLAIAASFLLIATVGFLGYRSINDLAIKEGHPVSQSIIEKDQLPNQPAPGHEVLPPENENRSPGEIEEVEADKVPILGPRQDKVSKVAMNKEAESGKNQENVAEYSDVLMEPLKNTQIEKEDNSGMKEVKQESPENTEEIDLQQIHIEEPPLEENLLVMEDIKEDNPAINKKKTYTEVTIIYKATNNSELVASGKQSILDKGLNKITKFSDEHLLTADRKTKLRNTTEDLLALNFGKLLNKSNKESEN